MDFGVPFLPLLVGPDVDGLLVPTLLYCSACGFGCWMLTVGLRD